MESNYHDQESRNWISEENMDLLGVGRSYECVFCKRGFNTAQALGGHMNIHRKNSARNKPPNSSTKQEENPRLHLHPSSEYRRQPHQPHLPYATYFPSTNSNLSESNYQDDSNPDRPQPSVAHGDWRMRLSSEKNQDKELDLELRLGYDS